MNLISIVMPVYNAPAGALAEALSSVMAQSLPDWECLCIDDGSEAGCQDRLDSTVRADARVRVVHQRNRGVSAARNRGLGVSRGRYLFFLDADDRIAPSCLRVLLDALEAGHAQWCSCNVEIVYENGVRKEDRSPEDYILDRRDFEKNLVRIDTSVIWGKLFDREWFMRQGLYFDTRLKVAEDSLLMTQAVCRADRIAHVGSCVGYVYRASEGGLMARSADLYARSQMDAFRILAGSGIWRRDCVAKRYVRAWLGNALNAVVTQLRRGQSEGMPGFTLPFLVSLCIAWPSYRLLLKLMLLPVWKLARRFTDRVPASRDLRKTGC